jgi:large subunit ribosomal protein L28
MSRICQVKGCGKRPRVGNLVSHANNKVKVWIYPNVHTMRYSYSNDVKNFVYRGGVCTKCLKSGKIRKVI